MTTTSIRTGNWTDLSARRALHHDLPEFATFHSGRRRTPDTLKSQSSIANAGPSAMHSAVWTIIGLKSLQLGDFASGDVNE
jgi:hypothetical protein